MVQPVDIRFQILLKEKIANTGFQEQSNAENTITGFQIL